MPCIHCGCPGNNPFEHHACGGPASVEIKHYDSGVVRGGLGDIELVGFLAFHRVGNGIPHVGGFLSVHTDRDGSSALAEALGVRGPLGDWHLDGIETPEPDLDFDTCVPLSPAVPLVLQHRGSGRITGKIGGASCYRDVAGVVRISGFDARLLVAVSVIGPYAGRLANSLALPPADESTVDLAALCALTVAIRDL